IYTGSTGTVPPGVIERHVSGFTDANLYVCGPVGFTELAECAAMTAGLAKDRIFINEHARIAPDRPSMD
ncbi:hypothetical protein, partial [Brachyspira hyodysenteriae]|uniref:hypothetical protein n=1 Tax=Brachyspira hyodysenteriae TaxID=159 RepID=UPI0019D403A5